jgi:hypothetical protein
VRLQLPARDAGANVRNPNRSGAQANENRETLEISRKSA